MAIPKQHDLVELYPDNLELQQVQVIFRHGDRTPISPRLQKTGLLKNWPYCATTSVLGHQVLGISPDDISGWTRTFETFERSISGDTDEAVDITVQGLAQSICDHGQLTDRGRENTLALGRQLRKLYIDKLAFLPSLLDTKTTNSIRLRATFVPRAAESTKQVFTGLYPQDTRTTGTPLPPIVQRPVEDETLLINEGACKRLAELANRFMLNTAKKWNNSTEMQHINQILSGYLDHGAPPIQVNSDSRLGDIMDTIHSTHAHSQLTKLPPEFYNPTLVTNIEKVCLEESVGGFAINNEYRKLGIGAFLGDIVQNMVKHTWSTPGTFRLGLYGCHDTTLSAILISLGVFDTTKDPWPPYTSSITVELFRGQSKQSSGGLSSRWPSSLRRSIESSRTPLLRMSLGGRQALDDYFVRVRYNGRSMLLPFCQELGKHLEGDTSLCTLATFKEAVDSFTPQDWKSECNMNLGQLLDTQKIENAPGL